MSFKKRLLSYLKAAPSMPWLTEVECLQNDYSQANNSTPYIDTEVKASWDLPFELVATVTKTSANRCLILGNAPNQRTFYVELTATNRLRFSSQDSTGTDPTFVEFNVYTSSSYPIPLNVPTKIWVKYNPLNDAAHTIKYEMGLEALDGSVSTTQTGSVYRSGEPLSTRLNLHMFNDYRTPVSTFNGGFKMHQCEIKMGTVHKKFIPCLDLNRIPCMYEQIEGKLYYNSGTSGFNSGRRIIEVEYMKLTGYQRFNTGFIANTLKHTLRTHFTYESETAAMMMGTRQRAAYAESCSFYIPAPNTSFPYSRMREDWAADTNTAVYSTNFTSNDHTVEITCGYAKVDGVVTTDTATSDYTMSKPWYFGCVYTINTNTFQYYQVGKMYFVELLDTYTREQYRYCVPAHDENNVGFFFDRVNHFIIDNEGSNTTDMTWGDEIHPVGFLYGGAPSRFNVGIVFYGHKWETDVRYNTVRTDLSLMGVSTGACNYWGVLNNSSGALYGQYSLHTSNAEFGLNIDPAETRTVFLDSYRNNADTYDMLSMTVEGQSVTRSTSEANRTTGYRIPDFQNSYPEPAYIYGNRCYDRTTNELLQNLITVQSGSKGSFLFDTITHTLINPISNIDNFTKGNDVIGYQIEPQLPYGFVEVDYLESTGTQYIDTGIKMNAGYGVMIEAKQTYTAKGTTRYLFGTYDSSNVTNYYIAVRSGNGNFIAVDGSTSAEGMFAYDGSFHEHKIENGNYYIDGTLKGALTTQSFTPTSTAYLFGCSNIGFGGDTWQIRKCKIFNETGRIIADYVPCLRIYDHKPCMFDLITRQFLTNQGTGEFAVGINGVSYTPVGYLQSTSAQYIDTGISGGDDDIEIGIKFKYNNFIAFGAIFGNWKTDAYNVTRLQLWDGGLGNDVSNLNTISSDSGNQYGTSITKDVVHNVIINKTSIKVDGVITTRTKLTRGTSNTNNICLFNRSLTSPNTSRNIGLQVYDFYVKKSNVEVQHLVPAVRQSDSKPGMLDMVTGTFLTNIGTGEFTYG